MHDTIRLGRMSYSDVGHIITRVAIAKLRFISTSYLRSKHIHDYLVMGFP